MGLNWCIHSQLHQQLWALLLWWIGSGLHRPKGLGGWRFLPTTSCCSHVGRLLLVMWSNIWLRKPVELLSGPGSYMLSATQHMPWAIRLSPASCYLLPFSYLKHALLLGFSSFPSHPTEHMLYNVCLLQCSSFLCSLRLMFWTSCSVLLIRCSYLFAPLTYLSFNTSLSISTLLILPLTCKAPLM